MHTLLTWSSNDGNGIAIYGHTEALHCSCDGNCNVGNCDVVDLWLRPLSCTDTDDGRFGFVWIQAESVGVESAVNRLQTIVNDAEGATPPSELTAECRLHTEPDSE